MGRHMGRQLYLNREWVTECAEQEWSLCANNISRGSLGQKYSMDSKSENLQCATFIFDHNLNTNVIIAPDQPKPEFASQGANRQEI